MEVRGWHRVCSDERGATALEFAFVVPILLILILGMLEFGFMFQGQLAVTHAAREGARLAAVAMQDGKQDEVKAKVIAVVANSDDPLKLGEDNVDFGYSDEAVIVTVSYPWTWQILSFGEQRILVGSATMRREQ